jgi:hypothetical protein
VCNSSELAHIGAPELGCSPWIVQERKVGEERLADGSFGHAGWWSSPGG